MTSWYMFILSNTLIVLGCSVRLSWVSSYRPKGRNNVFKNKIKSQDRVAALGGSSHKSAYVNGMNLAQELQQRLNTGHQAFSYKCISKK